ncbi:proteoglycan 4b isoform X2 [Haplochromis burtoni]|uniref:proteoglycan 4b isoform X2 n=1 Tax=Haplochromis burtoni TaxID=8153 RepID=UPI0006C9BE21|nr:proteoglycan 4b isoform X2 [Haplochromis burtoni]
MSSTLLCALIFLACALTFSGAQTSCRGRCGGEYYRGYRCQCDYNCLSYGECCNDYESQCTTKNSCKGRCGENFKRGRLCSCDSDCITYNQCCPDYKDHCDAQEQNSGEASAAAAKKTSSCNNVNDNKSKDQTLKEATDQLSTFSEGNDGDDSSVPPVGPTSHPPDDPTDDVSGSIFPTEDFSKTEPEDLEASPVPEISSDYELSTVDPLGEISTEATPTAARTPSDNDDLVSTTAEAPSDSTTADHVSSEPTSTSVPSVEPSSSTSSPQLDAQTPAVAIMDAVFPSDEPDNSLLTVTSASSTIPEEPTASNPSVLPSTSASSVGFEEISVVEAVTTHAPSPTTAAWSDATDDLQTSKPTRAQEPEPTPPVEKPEPYEPDPAKTTSKPDTKPLETQNIDDTGDYQADDSNDTNLCSGRPVSGVTTLRNGTMVVFRGHYFWLLDSNRVPGPPRGITQEWGVPSPIDTVFTRCNCQGKTYIFKGSQYWRFENDALDPGYPKVITTGFDRLQGHITAALSVPQYKRRAESVYFFKRGGMVQKYSYQAGVRPTCGKKVQYAVYTVRNRVVRQAAPVLGPVINIRTSWRGFPPAVTAAVSVPTTAEPEGYKYFVFSGPKSYNVRLDGERPVIAPPAAGSSPQSNNFIRCSQ